MEFPIVQQVGTPCEVYGCTERVTKVNGENLCERHAEELEIEMAKITVHRGYCTLEKLIGYEEAQKYLTQIPF